MTHRALPFAVVGFLSVWGALANAQADAPNAPAMPPPESSPATVYTYGAENRDCLEWTNACQTCKRNDAGVPACSTPGIACTPGAMVCRQMKPK